MTGRKLSTSVSYLTVFSLLSIVVLISYANTFNASWQFDDLPNIVNNKPLHIDNLMPDTLWQTFFAKPGRHELYRPVSCLSFALNWYLGDSDTTGYHVVNTCIHIFNAFLLFLIVKKLLTISRGKNKKAEEDIYFISMLTAILWAINPVQTMAVTYIVQRMAQLAAAFYLVGIFLYIRGRLSKSVRERWLCFFLCAITYMLAMGCKENASIFPMGLLIIETAFFQDLSDSAKRKKLAVISILLLASIAVVGAAIFLSGNFFANLNHSGSRFYTPLQRLITQPRILIFHLSQLFYPLPSRLSVEHDIFFSPSLFSPWTTLPALLLVVGLIAACVFKFNKRPVLCFSILFFFINHAIESSIINLELVFEHRNYLPSLFLFLGPACGLNRLVQTYKNKSTPIYLLLIACTIAVLASFGVWTYQRNMAWRTKQTLWIDAMKKAPGQARPINHVAIDLAWSGKPSKKDYQMALMMFEKSRSLHKARRDLDADIIGNIGNIYFQNGQLEEAIRYQEEALRITPKNKKIRLDLIKPLILKGQWDLAEYHAAKLLPNDRENPEYYNINGFILLWKHDPQGALNYFRKALRLAPFKPNILLNIGKALSLSGSYENAEWFLQIAGKLLKDDPMPLFALIENSMRGGDQKGTIKYVNRLFSRFPAKVINKQLSVLSNNHRTIPFSYDDISGPIEQGFAMLCKTRSIF